MSQGIAKDPWSLAMAQRVTYLTERLAKADTLLLDCSNKLMLYYERSAEYVGGQEHSQLQARIAAFRDTVAPEGVETRDVKGGRDVI